MVQDLIKDKNIKIFPEKMSENIGKPKKLLKINYKKNSFTRQQGFHKKRMHQYGKRVKPFSQDNRKHS